MGKIYEDCRPQYRRVHSLATFSNQQFSYTLLQEDISLISSCPSGRTFYEKS
jgi:hypothetical protein